MSNIQQENKINIKKQILRLLTTNKVAQDDIKIKGSILIMTLVFTAIFTVTTVGLAGMVSYQNRLAKQKVAWHNALNISEAGINYYRWHLAHAPEDYLNDVGVHDYTDPEAGTLGQYNLEITAPSSCSSVISIKSTGWSTDYPDTKRIIQAEYGLASMASFAFITNSDAWFGDTEVLHGPVHSNGGIRMDGINDSLMTSAKETYTCQAHHSCDPPEIKDGVWGTGEDQNLWEYPTSNVDFDMLTVDLSALKDIAETSGIYLRQQGLGYRLNFKADGTVDVYKVTKLKNNVWYYGMDGDWHRGSWDIDRQSFEANYSIPSTCGIIFVEDNVWVDGIVNTRTTVVAAKIPEVPNNRRTIIINDDITYQTKDGSNVLGLIAQQDIIVPLYAAPDDLEIDAAMLAQNGSVYRPYYYYPWPYYLRDTITTYGTIITNQVWTWSWVNGSGQTISGYEHTNTTYDPNLNYNPPPGFPTYGEYKFLQWEEVTEK
ncbi:MAG: pilus assembly PilX N-terminal domain-containing protein [Patescibacteria group bacterium]